MFGKSRYGAILMLYLKRNKFIVLFQLLQMLDKILYLLSTEPFIDHWPEIKRKTRIILTLV